MSNKEIQMKLAESFPADLISWKPQSVKGNRALAVAYIDARDVMNRLDDVVGLGNWQDDYQVMPDGSVTCRLKVRLGEEWITKMDVGSESEQPDSGDRLKAAFSDALKRAAVKFGIGRFLYDLPKQWCDYDPVKKQFTQQPKLPAKFATQSQPQPAEPPARAEPADWELPALIMTEAGKLKMPVSDALAKLNKKYGTDYNEFSDFEPEQLRAFLAWLVKQ